MSRDKLPSVISELERLPSALSRHLGSRLLGAWIFGSRARGEATAESDYDVAVLTEPPLGLERLALAERIGRELGLDIDLVDLRTGSATLAWEVITTGRVIVEADEDAIAEFIRRARFDAEDELRRNRIIVEAQRRSS